MPLLFFKLNFLCSNNSYLPRNQLKNLRKIYIYLILKDFIQRNKEFPGKTDLIPCLIFIFFLQLMQRTKDSKEEFFNSFRKIKAIVGHLLVELTYQEICFIYRSVSHHLMYFINSVHLGLSDSKLMQDQLKECIRTILTIVKSTEYEIYGHKFPLLSFVAKKYQKLTQSLQISLDQKKMIQRTIKNDQSLRYISQRTWLNYKQQIGYLKSQNFIQFSQSMRLQDHTFQNHQCICCSRIFTQGFEVSNQNPFFSTLISLNYLREFNRTQLQKYLTATCNEGGGVILVGSHQQQNIIRTQGIKFTSNQEIQKSQKLLLSVIAKIKPGCYYIVERVLVNPNYVAGKTSYTKEHLRICLRISVFPISTNKLTYIQIQNSEEIANRVYVFDEKKKPKLVKHTSDKLQQTSLYELIYQNYKNIKPKINSHYPVRCLKPESNLCQMLSDRFSNDQQVFKQIQNQEQRRQIENLQVSDYLVDEPVFKYEHSCLLVVPSKNYNNQVTTFTKKLMQIKEPFDLCKPFKDYFNVFDPTSRSIWLISHKMKCRHLKRILQDLQRLQILKQSIIKVMPISNFLQFQYSKLTRQKQKQFTQAYQQRYKENLSYEIVTSNSSQKLIHYNFQDYSRSIFAYMILQKLQLRSYFVQEGKTYKKKSQKIPKG